MTRITVLRNTLLFCLSVAGNSYAAGEVTYPTLDGGLTTTAPEKWNYCAAEVGGIVSAGPQSPRDIDSATGTNSTLFRTSNNPDKMSLCDIHYHWNAEHKSTEYSTPVNSGDEHSGWAIVAPVSTDPVFRAENDISKLLGDPSAHEIGVIPGDTIEIHWVYTSCDVDYAVLDPVNGLGNCTSKVCANPELRVVAQVFEVVEHNADLTILDAPMAHNDATVVYAGSTTGPGFNNDHCSPFQVTWDVKQTAATIDAHALAEWSHTLGEHAHGVRELVTRDNLLSPIATKGKP